MPSFYRAIHELEYLYARDEKFREIIVRLINDLAEACPPDEVSDMYESMYYRARRIRLLYPEYFSVK